MVRQPKWLKGEAAAYWQRHAKGLNEVGLLTDRDVDSFAQLCELWRLLRECDGTKDSKEAIRYSALTKLYRDFAKQFGLMPRDRKRGGLEPEQTLADVLDKMESR